MQPQEPGERTAAALYIRSAKGDSGNTLETQLEALRRYAWTNGLDPVRVYFETQGSRNQFERMIMEAGEPDPPFRRILVTGYDRFAHSQEEFQSWTQWLQERGVSVVSITDPPGNTHAG